MCGGVLFEGEDEGLMKVSFDFADSNFAHGRIQPKLFTCKCVAL